MISEADRTEVVMPKTKKKKTGQQGLFDKKVSVSAYKRRQGRLPPRHDKGQWRKARKS